MDVQSALILSLVKFYPVAQIEAMWRQALDALVSRSTSTLTITGTTFDGSTSTGMVLNTPEEIANFISACEAAVNQINGVTTANPADLGTPPSFACRTLQV